METGGRASKLGDTYERLWAVRHALMVLDGRYRSLLWEPVGEDANGIDLQITANDGHRVLYQLKRQRRSREYWTVANLREEGVLQHARHRLESDARSEYVFVSSCGVRHLRDLAEQSHRANDNPELFLRDHVRVNKERTTQFSELLVTWGFDPENPTHVARSFRLLQRMQFLVQERGTWEREQLALPAGLLLDGNPAAAVAALGDYLDANYGNDLHEKQLRKGLLDRGIRFRVLASDQSLPSTVTRLRDRFDTAIRDELIASVPIPRPEAAELVTRLQSEHPPRIVFVHGRAGSGKSVVVHQIFQALTAASVPCLPVQLHLRRPEGTPHEYGRAKLGLPASPALCLRAIAGDGPAVLILDQLDALRLTSTHSREAWDVCAELIEEGLADERTTVVLACRTFDLENDPNIATWIRQFESRMPNLVAKIHVGELPEDAIADLLSRHNVNFATLPARQRSLLRHPATLALWWRLAEAGMSSTAFDNVTQLMREVLTLCRNEAQHDHGATPADQDHVIAALVDYMDTNGRHDAPEALASNYEATVGALCSVGLLRRDDASVSFVHQCYFDHLVAEKVLREAFQENDAPIGWIKVNQSLFRRDQLRQLLTMLRDSDPARHADLLRTILVDPGVRFHLKHLVLGLLSQADPPTDGELALVEELAQKSEWWEQIHRTVIWRKPAWFDALRVSGCLARWLATWKEEESIRMLLSFFRSIVEHRGDHVDELLDPFWSAGEPWAERLTAVVSIDPCDDSPRISAHRIAKIRAGEWALSDIYFDRIAERDAARITPLLEAAILSWIDRLVRYMSDDGDDEAPVWPLRGERLDASVLAAVRDDALRAWPVFSHALRTLVTLSRIANRKTNSVEGLVNRNWSLSHGLRDACACMENLASTAADGLATHEPEEMARLVRDLTVPKIRGLERALARGLSAGGKPLADAAILWLCDRPSRFHLGDGRNELYNAPATTLIRSLAPLCSQSVFERLQSTILSYHDDWERASFRVQFNRTQNGNYGIRNAWGQAQNHLLHALPVERMSRLAIHRASIWRAKFGDPSEERPLNAYSSGGWVTSSIPPNKRQFVSDREWCRIIAREWPERDGRPWKQHDPDTVGEASLRHFSEAFGNAAEQAPKRFARLALKIPPTADPAYFAALVGALAKCPATGDEPNNVTIRELEAIIDHVGNCRAGAYVHSLCRLIESHSEVVWSDAVIYRIVSYVDHPEPRADEFTVRTSRPSDGQMEPDIETSAINCVRGCVAGAINHLLWICPDAYEGLSSAAKRLLADENPAVRLEAIGACLPTWNRDKDRAIRLVLNACEHPDDRVLQSRWLSELIRHARGTHLDDLAPLIDRMAKSSVEKVARWGSAWATACWLDDRHLPELFTLCRSGSKAQRLGVTTAAVDHASRGDSSKHGLPLIIELFDDEDSDVRSEAAHVFRIEDIFDFPGGTDLTSAYVRSRAFLDDPHSLFYPLSDYRGALASLAAPILEAVDVVCNQLAEPSRDISRGVGLIGNEASTLLLRLYELAYGNKDKQLQSTCLDRWDAMLRNRVGMTEAHLKQLDD